MSRTFVNEHAAGAAPRRGCALARRDGPRLDAAAAALLEAARMRASESAGSATGHRSGDDRLAQLEERVLH
jgi:hypothetical protein